MTNSFGEPAPMLGPSKTWSAGKYKLMHYNHRLSLRWGFQIGSVGSEADNPFTAAYRAWRFYKKREAEIRARQK